MCGILRSKQITKEMKILDKAMRVEIFHVTEDPDSNITYINAEANFIPPEDPAGAEK